MKNDYIDRSSVALDEFVDEDLRISVISCILYSIEIRESVRAKD